MSGIVPERLFRDPISQEIKIAQYAGFSVRTRIQNHSNMVNELKIGIYSLTITVKLCIIKLMNHILKVLIGKSRADPPSENENRRLRVLRQKGRPNVVREPPG